MSIKYQDMSVKILNKFKNNVGDFQFRAPA